MVSCGISTPFDVLFPSRGKVAHALLTRPPLKHLGASSSMSPLDLHVLGTPPAFVLSQDQTLPFNPIQTLKLFPVLKLNSSESLSLLIALLSFNLYRFQGSPHSLSQVPDYIITTPPFCQALFSSFLKVFSPFCITMSFRALYGQIVQIRANTKGHGFRHAPLKHFILPSPMQSVPACTARRRS